MKQSSQLKSIVSDLIFYGVLVSVVVAVLALSGSKSGAPKVFGGYSAFVVLTGSMEDVIPKGSLVITKSADAAELEIGDDITYMISERATVTHRIIGIQENYLDTGERAFLTQGVMNKEPDRNPVAAVNVVGRVIYHNKPLGNAVSFAQDNWPLIIFFIVVLLIFIKVLELILRKETKERELQTKEQDVKPAEDDFEIEIIELP